MKVQGKNYRTIWIHPTDVSVVQIIDQRQLPHRFVVEDLKTLEDVAIAIEEMHVRGAPLIGAAAACGMHLAAIEATLKSPSKNFDHLMQRAAERLRKTRPTAVNLNYAIERVFAGLIKLKGRSKWEQGGLPLLVALNIIEESVQHCRSMGEHGLKLIEKIYEQKQAPVNVLTHCNAGWLACIDYGTATAPIYAAQEKGIPVHVWVDETRPRNQGASLTAFELLEQGIPHTIIADNTGGHLMQHGMVDLVIVGTDRTTRTGDVANKIGTYLKALAAKDNGVPFYVAAPSSSIDWNVRNGLAEIPIEQRSADEVRCIEGLGEDGEVKKILLTPKDSPAANYAFDVTPARLVTGLITERGVCEASEEGLARLFLEKSPAD